MCQAGSGAAGIIIFLRKGNWAANGVLPREVEDGVFTRQRYVTFAGRHVMPWWERKVSRAHKNVRLLF